MICDVTPLLKKQWSKVNDSFQLFRIKQKTSDSVFNLSSMLPINMEKLETLLKRGENRLSKNKNRKLFRKKTRTLFINLTGKRGGQT